MRLLYRSLLWLHPRSFRREFGDEILWIFDQSRGADSLALFGDALRSLGRQWLLRSNSWKIAAALLIASFQVILGGLGMLIFGHHQAQRLSTAQPDFLWRNSNFAHSPITMGELMTLILFIVTGLVIMLIFTVAWSNRMASRRRLPSYRERLCSNSVR